MLNVPKNFQVVMETSIEVAIKYIIEDIHTKYFTFFEINSTQCAPHLLVFSSTEN